MVRSIVSDNKTPGLDSVLLSCNASGVLLYSTDMVNAVTVRTPTSVASVTESGHCSVNADLFKSAVGRTDGEVSLHVVGNKLRMRSEHSDYTLILSDEEPPKYYVSSGNPSLTLSDVQLNYLAALAGACSEDPGANATTGVHFNLEHQEAVATDQRALAVLPLGNVVTSNTKVTVNGKALKLLPKLGGEAGLYVNASDPHGLEFRGENWTVWACLVAGEYPPYRSIMPSDPAKSGSISVVVDRKDLLTALESAAVIPHSRLELNATTDSLTLSGASHDAGSSEAWVECASTGDVLTYVPSGYLLRCLKGEDCSSIKLYYYEPSEDEGGTGGKLVIVGGMKTLIATADA